jgi:acyl-coenzyme A synthetase/AMP-(fatty) acid ligase
MGDIGYLDDQNRFWYCGRKSHRVETAAGTLYSIPIEHLFDQVPFVRKCALVSIVLDGKCIPAIVYELELPRTIFPDSSVPDAPCTPQQLAAQIPAQLRAIAAKNSHTNMINYFIERKRIPVDIRHNSKIRREELSDWATSKFSDDTK